MRRGDWTVGSHGVRPAGPPDACFYCGRKVGAEQHAEDCVIRSRTVVVEFRVRLVVSVPEGWGEDVIDFKFNESSWCADNLVEMLEPYVCDKEDDAIDRACLCNFVEASYVREATDDDERFSCVRVAGLVS